MDALQAQAPSVPTGDAEPWVRSVCPPLSHLPTMTLEARMREAVDTFKLAADLRARSLSAAGDIRDTYADAMADFAAVVVELMHRGRRA